MTKPKALDQRISSEQLSEINRRSGSAPNVDPERLSEIKSQASHGRWSQPGASQRQSEVLAKSWTPEKRRKASEYAKSPEVAARLAAGASKASRNRWANDNGRMSETMKAVWADPEHKQRLLDAARSPEKREKSRQAALAQWAARSPEEQQAEMGRLHSTVKGGHHMSALEAQVVMVLNRLGVWYKLHALTGKYVADILVQSSPMVDIECDGDYWHQDKPSDAERDIWFTANGYNVIRLRDADIPNMTEILTAQLT